MAIKILFQNPSIVAGPLAAILIFGLPIVDTTWAILRRLRRQISPFRADGRHVHHRLMIIGLTQRQTVAILYAASLLSSVAGLAIAMTDSEESAVIVFVSMLIVALIGASVLGHAVPFKPIKPTKPQIGTV